MLKQWKLLWSCFDHRHHRLYDDDNHHKKTQAFLTLELKTKKFKIIILFVLINIQKKKTKKKNNSTYGNMVRVINAQEPKPCTCVCALSFLSIFSHYPSIVLLFIFLFASLIWFINGENKIFKYKRNFVSQFFLFFLTALIKLKWFWFLLVEI